LAAVFLLVCVQFSVLSCGLQAEAPVLVMLLKAVLQATIDPANGAIAQDHVSRWGGDGNMSTRLLTSLTRDV
jgi:hypothetical protein